jgi:hypothetical protein
MYGPRQKQNGPPTARSSGPVSSHAGFRAAKQTKRPGVESQPMSGWGNPRYDFARVPVFPTPVGNTQARLSVNVSRDAHEQEADRMTEQITRTSDPQTLSTADVSGHIPEMQAETGGGVKAPPIVHEVLRSPGQPLDAATRALMEPRLGHDFSQVRVHTDEKAAESARAVGAKAYMVGSNLVFGAEEYAPGSLDGQKLLAHELIHVVQQQGTASPALRRKAVATWAGEFDTDLYGLVKSTRQGDLDTYGLGIRLKFTPGKKVNADKIALVQSVISLNEGNPIVTYNDPKGVTAKRMTDVSQGDTQTGRHIDAWPHERTPVTGMTTAEKQSELSESVPGPAKASAEDVCAPGTIGFGSRAKGKKPEDAKMCDTPTLAATDKQAASQHFETTALAVEGEQKGIYYGSVNWGWEKAAGAKEAKLLDLTVASRNVPSGDFARVAELWNKSLTDDNKPTIPLPTGETKFISKGRTDLVDEPSHTKPKTLGQIPLNTQVEVVKGIVTTNPGWTRVVVVEGGQAGMSGWVKSDALADHHTDVEKTEPKQKK